MAQHRQENTITADSVDGKEREEILAMFVKASGVTEKGDSRANSKKMIEVTASLLSANGVGATDEVEAPAAAAMEEDPPRGPEAEDLDEGGDGEGEGGEGEDVQPPVAPVRASTRVNRGRRAALFADEHA